VSAIRQTLTIFKRIAIVVGIAIAFSLGLLGAIYLSLRSSETRVPDIVGKDRMTAENAISDAGLNFRVRAMRATSEAKADTVLIQLPHAGEIVKVGQTVAVDISRPSQDGEAPAETNTNTNTNAEASNSNNQQNNSSANNNTNANKQKKKPANTNGNLNANGNTNRPARNLNGNVNRPTNSGNLNSAPRTNLNANTGPARTNTNRGTGNANTTRRPPTTAPTP